VTISTAAYIRMGEEVRPRPSFSMIQSQGGAGHVQRLQLHMREVLHEALECVGKCSDCAPDSSCYACLRNYWNQPFHSQLQRGIAAEFLADMIVRLYPG
jgi:hypothetical protein